MAASVKPKSLVPAKFLENTQTTQFTADNATVQIDKCTVTNTSASAVTFSIHLVSTGSSGASNQIIKDQSVASGSVYLCNEIVGHILATGGKFSAIASEANALVICVSGREIT
ncbi:hypothetical protein [Acinetobacter baumannii]|uniref:hypothetical protein n=1 Tax=Acinetobacter baumannii TaxID=470 RepID=UPI00234216CA|nr:hypothetical protein [Acinetobacter baumannii]MDC4094891.1 hypothetical protein [Acinetobacter baumannii]